MVVLELNKEEVFFLLDRLHLTCPNCPSRPKGKKEMDEEAMAVITSYLPFMPQGQNPLCYFLLLLCHSGCGETLPNIWLGHIMGNEPK